MRILPLERAIFFDHIDVIFGLLKSHSSIQTSRKRKLQQVYTVGTRLSTESVIRDVTHTSVPPPNAVERGSLKGNVHTQ